MSDPRVSLIVPIYNEQESLSALHDQIVAVARERELIVEIIFVDDGSKDLSWQVVREIAGRDERVRGMRFRRNFGKAAALAAGFRSANGSRIITLDADLQDDPAEIPNFLVAAGQGARSRRRLEKNPPRSLAQSFRESGLQLDRELPDWIASARPQLRNEGDDGCSDARPASIWRDAPIHPRARRGARLSRRRIGHSPSTAAIWPVKIRVFAHFCAASSICSPCVSSQPMAGDRCTGVAAGP